MNQKTLKFVPDLVPLVLSGEKTTTWRLFDDKALAQGDVIDLINRAEGKVFATARITLVKEKALGNITADDYTGHEKYENPDELIRTFRRYYGAAVTAKTLVKLIDFQIINQ